MAWPKSFQPESGECEGCSHVRQHVSGCLPEKSPEGSNPQDRGSLNQTVADRIFHAWGRPFVDLFALGKNTKLANSPTSAETAQADLLTPLSSASVESQPSRYRGYQGIPQGERIF